MARVYRADDTQAGGEVALKILKPEYHASHDVFARFEREARSMSRIRHDHVVPILGFPQTETVQAIAMELLVGGSLQRRMDSARQGKIQIKQAATWIMQAASGLGAAHDKGMVHRDIKPSNLLFDAEDQVKVADFGAILLLENATWVTGVGQQVGTPAYMSPEQCRGERVTPATDVYSLGATLFELVTGRLPFTAEESSPFAIMLKHISAPLPDPQSLREDLPDWLASIIRTAMTKSPADRYQNGGDLSRALSEGLAGRGSKTEHEADPDGLIDLDQVRSQLLQLPLRAIVCWACRCARRAQPFNGDPRLDRALSMAEATLTDSHRDDSSASLSRVLSRIQGLRVASLKTAYPDQEERIAPCATQAARAAAAAASCAAARCIEDAAADAAFAARNAVKALYLADGDITHFWQAARADYKKLRAATRGQEGTIGKPIDQARLDPY
jgi:serine/threonine protein kinase